MKPGLFVRWLLPLVLVLAGMALSAYVFFGKLPPAARVFQPRTLLLLLGTPVVSIGILLLLRGSVRLSGNADRSADLLIIWVLTFLFGVHAAVLATMLGMVGSLRAVVPSVVALLLLGLGPAVATLSPGSPLGIRTASTLADDHLWRRTHRLAGWLFGAAGLCGVVGAQIGGPWALVSGVGPAVIALIIALGYGSQPPSASSDEQIGMPGRLEEESSVDATDS